MPWSDELKRDYTIEEAKVWREVQHFANTNPLNPRVVKIGKEFGVKPQRARQWTRTWENDGLVVIVARPSGTVTLTTFGRRFTFEDRYSELE